MVITLLAGVVATGLGMVVSVTGIEFVYQTLRGDGDAVVLAAGIALSAVGYLLAQAGLVTLGVVG